MTCPKCKHPKTALIDYSPDFIVADIEQCQKCRKVFIPQVEVLPAATAEAKGLYAEAIAEQAKFFTPLSVIIFGPGEGMSPLGYKKRREIESRARNLGHEGVLPEDHIPQGAENEGHTLEEIERNLCKDKARMYIVIGGFPGSNAELGWLRDVDELTIVFFPKRYKKSYVDLGVISDFALSGCLCRYELRPEIDETKFLAGTRDDFRSCFIATVAEWAIKKHTAHLCYNLQRTEEAALKNKRKFGKQ